MRILPLAAVAFAVALLTASASRAELVARGVDDGRLALTPAGAPRVAYVRGTRLVIAERVAKGRWNARNAGAVAAGSSVVGFAVGAKGPVALVQSADDRLLVLVRRRGSGWQRVRLAGRLPAGSALGWPGLVLNGQGLPVVAYTRWTAATRNTQLVLVRVDDRGRVRAQRITAGGFPQSQVPPPATPVLVGGRVHVIQGYGWRGFVALLEWYPDGRTWTGLGLDAAIGEFPFGPVVARATASGTVYAAWSLSMVGEGFFPVSLVSRMRGGDPTADYVGDRAFTTSMAVPATGPEVAANEWVADNPLDLTTSKSFVWAGTVIGARGRVELDGWIAGIAVAAGRGRDLLLARSDGLSWFRSPGALTTGVTLAARRQPDGSVSLSGRVRGAASGTVVVYRERNGTTRHRVRQASVSGGAFSLRDAAPPRPFVYRAVYTDPATGIPYGALVREGPVRQPDDGDDGPSAGRPPAPAALQFRRSGR